MNYRLLFTQYILFFVLFVCFGSPALLAGNAGNIMTGTVVSAETGQPLPFINIIIEGTNYGTFTNDHGHFILEKIPAGNHRLVITAMGYKTQLLDVQIHPTQPLHLSLVIEEVQLDLNYVMVTASPTASGFRYQSDMGFYGESLQRRSEASFGEMLDGEPGLAMRSMGSAPARPVIRGMDGDRILILEHGERMGDVSASGAGHSLSMDPLSANRVEVVKGPASLMYGPSALGGVINLMTADIPEDWSYGSSGVVSAQGASVNKMGAGFLRYTKGNQQWAATARLAYRGSGNLMTPEGVMPGTYMDNFDGALGFGFDRSNTRGGISFSANRQIYGLPEEMDDPDEEIEVRQYRYGMQGRVTTTRNGFFDNAQLRFHATYLDQKEIEIEYDDGEIEEDVELSHEKHSISSTLTLQHRPIGIFDRGAIGLNMHGHNLEIGGDEAYTPGERRANLGIFTFQEIPVSNRWRMQAGLRGDIQYTKALANHIFPDVNQSRSAVNLTGSVGVNYRPTQHIEIGGQLARALRNPTVEELFADGPHLCSGVYEVGSTDLKDEIGLGADLFADLNIHKLQLELAGFYYNYSNYIIFEPTGQTDELSSLPIFIYEGDQARLFGGEASANLQLTEKFRTRLSADYVNARRTSQGREYLPFIPPLRYRAEFEYTYSSGWISAHVRHVKAQDKVAIAEEITGSYTLMGLTTAYRIDYHGRHVIIVRMENIFNTKYRDHLSRVEDRQFPMPGRNINLAYRFYFH